MKRISRVLCVVMALVIAVMVMPVSASAITVNEARDGVVFITSSFDGIVGIKTGSGFALGDAGGSVQYIVTNAHVVTLDPSEVVGDITSTLRASEVVVYFSYAANSFMRAQIVVLNESKDICVLKLPEPTTARTPLVLCRSSAIDMNDSYSALGYPGLADFIVDVTSIKYDTSDITMTRGSISRQITDAFGRDCYQIDVNIQPGNSGGPLVNSNGEVVGIVTYYVGDGEGSLNYAITIDEMLRLIDRSEIHYTLSTDAPAIDPVLIIIIAAAVVVIAAVIVIIVVMGKKKNRQPAAAGAYAPAGNVGATGIITGMKGLLSDRRYNINGSIIIGRNPQKCNVCFPVDAKGVSGVHCQIRQVNGGYEIMDLGSSNGTFLGNGERLAPNVPVFIPDGTYFYLGSSDQLFQIKY